jgi:hypothetical protein
MFFKNAAFFWAAALLSLMTVGCAAPQNLSGIQDTQARWSRGGGHDGYYFTLNPVQRQRMIHEINGLPLGCSTSETIQRLGKADLVYQTDDQSSLPRKNSACSLFYSFTQKYNNRSTSEEDEQVELCFFDDKLISIKSGVEQIPQRPVMEAQLADPSDEKVVIMGTYPSPQWSEDNEKNHLNIKRLMRSENIAYETWPMGKVFQILVSRSDAQRAQRALCRAVRESKIIARINGCPEAEAQLDVRLAP